MQLIMLAGGMATRLRPITEKIPKSMVPINGRPFLEYQLDLLKQNGIRDIVLCVGYLSEQIESHFGDGSKFGVNIKYSTEKDVLLGTAGALKNAEEYLDDVFFLMYGDSYLPINFNDVTNFFGKYSQPALMVVYKNYNKYDTSNISLKDNFVREYDKSSKANNLSYIDYGLSILRKDVIKKLPENVVYSLECLYSDLIRREELLAFETNTRFYEVGSFKGLEEFRNYASSLKL